jgi:hypothetical protein
MAGPAEALFRAERTRRDTAKAELDGQIARIREDMEQRGIGGRIVDEATAKALAALDNAADIASENKGVIGATVTLLALWFLRQPILSALAAMLGADEDEKGRDHDY